MPAADRFADPDEVVPIVAALAARYADLLARLSRHDGNRPEIPESSTGETDPLARPPEHDGGCHV